MNVGCLVWIWLFFFQWVDRWLEILLILIGCATFEATLRALYLAFAKRPNCPNCCRHSVPRCDKCQAKETR